MVSMAAGTGGLCRDVKITDLVVDARNKLPWYFRQKVRKNRNQWDVAMNDMEGREGLSAINVFKIGECMLYREFPEPEENWGEAVCGVSYK